MPQNTCRFATITKIGFCAALSIILTAAGGGVNERAGDRLQPLQAKDSFTLRHENGTDTVRLILIATDRCLYSQPTRGLVERQDVDKVQFTADLPFIGGLFEGRVRRDDFRRSPVIGSAYFYDGVLTLELAKPTGGVAAAATDDVDALINQIEDVKSATVSLPSSKLNGRTPRYVIVANGDYAYGVRADAVTAIAHSGPSCPPSSPAVTPHVVLNGLYDSGALTQQSIGTVHDRGDGLLVLVKPSIIDPARGGLF